LLLEETASDLLGGRIRVKYKKAFLLWKSKHRRVDEFLAESIESGELLNGEYPNSRRSTFLRKAIRGDATLAKLGTN
jgi:hypothetical protein